MRSFLCALAKDKKCEVFANTRLAAALTKADASADMKTLPKVLLVASVLSFAASLTGPGSEVWFGTLKPAGALLFIVAFIVHVVSRLDPEQYAADQALREELLHRRSGSEPVLLPTAKPVAA